MFNGLDKRDDFRGGDELCHFRFLLLWLLFPCKQPLLASDTIPCAFFNIRLDAFQTFLKKAQGLQASSSGFHHRSTLTLYLVPFSLIVLKPFHFFLLFFHDGIQSPREYSIRADSNEAWTLGITGIQYPRPAEHKKEKAAAKAAALPLGFSLLFGWLLAKDVVRSLLSLSAGLDYRLRIFAPYLPCPRLAIGGGIV